MPYPVGHRDATKAKIIRAARRLFNRFGFDRVSVEQIMAAAGLTRGGFYRYFESKSDLYAEALGCFFTDPGWEKNWDGVEVDLTAADIGPQIVRAYLSRQHFEDIDNSCPMVALPSDIGRSGKSAKRAYETVFKAMGRYSPARVASRSPSRSYGGPVDRGVVCGRYGHRQSEQRSSACR